jgi:hypothetical protein
VFRASHGCHGYARNNGLAAATAAPRPAVPYTPRGGLSQGLHCIEYAVWWPMGDHHVDVLRDRGIKRGSIGLQTHPEGTPIKGCHWGCPNLKTHNLDARLTSRLALVTSERLEGSSKTHSWLPHVMTLCG